MDGGKGARVGVPFIRVPLKTRVSDLWMLIKYEDNLCGSFSAVRF